MRVHCIENLKKDTNGALGACVVFHQVQKGLKTKELFLGGLIDPT